MGLLTDGRTTMDNVRTALQRAGFDIVKESYSKADSSGAALVVAFLPHVNGLAAVDVVNQPWPDAMGDPKSDPALFGAWAMGEFGPFAFPGSLARAGQHSWSWQPGQTIAEGHRGFIRVRLSYVFGGEKEAAVLPQDYDPLSEMMFLSGVALATLQAPGVLCYFNPNGEVLRDEPSFREIWDACQEQKRIPLPLWTNIRFFGLSQELGFMDTVGNSQLDIQDIEAVFPTNQYHPGDIDYYLRNVTHYLLDLDREPRPGEAIDGPGETGLSWTIEVLEAGLAEPPRQVIRLYPTASRNAVREALAAER